MEGRKVGSNTMKISTVNQIRIAARGGDLHAALFLGLSSANGWLSPRNTSKAIEWLEVAASAGVSVAYHALGMAYLEVGDSSAYRRSAFRWFCEGAAAGDVSSLFMKGVCLLGGRGTRKNSRQGLICLMNAAGSGLAAAGDELAVYYMKSGDLKSALKWAQRSVRMGDAVARLRLEEIRKRLRNKAEPPARRHKTALKQPIA
jgi:TPR repeat protein